MGLIYSTKTLFWTLIVILLLSYVFALLGVSWIGASQDDDSSELYDVIARENFGGLGRTMQTLLQVFTLDSASNIYRPLISRNPLLAAYFVSYILLASIALMNLVTAVMVEQSMEQANKNREGNRERKKSERAETLEKV